MALGRPRHRRSELQPSVPSRSSPQNRQVLFSFSLGKELWFVKFHHLRNSWTFIRHNPGWVKSSSWPLRILLVITVTFCIELCPVVSVITVLGVSLKDFKHFIIPYLLEYKAKIFSWFIILNMGGSSYIRAQSSKNRANVFVINNTVKICLGWVLQLFHCVIFFCFITYRETSCMATSVNRWMLFSVVVLWNVSRLVVSSHTTAVLQRQDRVRNTTHIPCFIPCISLHEYDVHLVFKNWIYPFFNCNIYN
jgi:hypothetical protein